MPEQLVDDQPQRTHQTEEDSLRHLRRTLRTMYLLPHLDPIILSQNAEHIQSILNEENTLNLDDKEI